MRVVYEYSHLGGAEILQVRYPDCGRDIYEVIAGIAARRIKISKEKTMRGRQGRGAAGQDEVGHDGARRGAAGKTSIYFQKEKQ